MFITFQIRKVSPAKERPSSVDLHGPGACSNVFHRADTQKYVKRLHALKMEEREATKGGKHRKRQSNWHRQTTESYYYSATGDEIQKTNRR